MHTIADHIRAVTRELLIVLDSVDPKGDVEDYADRIVEAVDVATGRRIRGGELRAIVHQETLRLLMARSSRRLDALQEKVIDP